MKPCTFRPKISKRTTEDDDDKVKTKIGDLKNVVKNMKDHNILNFSMKKKEGTDSKKSSISTKIVRHYNIFE